MYMHEVIPQIRDLRSLCTDVPPPSEKIGRRDVCESPTIIMFPFPRFPVFPIFSEGVGWSVDRLGFTEKTIESKIFI